MRADFRQPGAPREARRPGGRKKRQGWRCQGQTPARRPETGSRGPEGESCRTQRETGLEGPPVTWKYVIPCHRSGQFAQFFPSRRINPKYGCKSLPVTIEIIFIFVYNGIVYRIVFFMEKLFEIKGNYLVACGGKRRQLRCRNRRNGGALVPK
jgi:hypothetical protein